MKPSTVNIFGNFGTQNLGNECTLQAVIHNVRQYLPDAPLRCICTDPEDTSRRYNVTAVAMSSGYAHREASTASARRTHPLLRLLRGIVIRIPRELMHWVTAFKTLKDGRMLIMAGTGMLDDFGIRPFDLHYEIFKWSLLAKLRRCKLLFVSVGTGRLEHPLSRWFVKAALALADYRSYRDRSSRDLLGSLGIAARRDFVYPDLVFSFPRPAIRREPRHRTGPVVGLGLMEYYGRGCRPEHGRAIYHEYIEKVTTFVAWLLQRGYTVRLLIGDVVYDSRASDDVIGRLKERHVVYDESRLIHGPVSSVDQLISPRTIGNRRGQSLPQCAVGSHADQAGGLDLVLRAQERGADGGDGVGGVLPTDRRPGSRAPDRAIPGARGADGNAGALSRAEIRRIPGGVGAAIHRDLRPGPGPPTRARRARRGDRRPHLDPSCRT